LFSNFSLSFLVDFKSLLGQPAAQAISESHYQYQLGHQEKGLLEDIASVFFFFLSDACCANNFGLNGCVVLLPASAPLPLFFVCVRVLSVFIYLPLFSASLSHTCMATWRDETKGTKKDSVLRVL
jgi:hypothetical protein